MTCAMAAYGRAATTNCELCTQAGDVLTYEHRMSCVELDLGSGTGQALVDAGYVNPTIGTAFFNLSQSCPYNFGVVTESLNEVSYDMPTASWRSVYSAQARTAEEILVDEIAKALGTDPVAMRRKFLKTADARAVLDKVASEGNWGRTMSSGTAQGVALHAEYRSIAACLVEIDCTRRQAAGHQGRHGPGRRAPGESERSAGPGDGQPHRRDQHRAAGRKPPG